MASQELFKISQIWTCLCGWVHVSQGKCSCWVCRQVHDPVPMNTARQAYYDLQAMRWSADRMRNMTHDQDDRTPRDNGWPEHTGLLEKDGKYFSKPFGGMA